MTWCLGLTSQSLEQLTGGCCCGGLQQLLPACMPAATVACGSRDIRNGPAAATAPGLTSPDTCRVRCGHHVGTMGMITGTIQVTTTSTTRRSMSRRSQLCSKTRVGYAAAAQHTLSCRVCSFGWLQSAGDDVQGVRGGQARASFQIRPGDAMA